MQDLIKNAVSNTLRIANVKGSISVTPSTISIEDIKTELEAKTLEAAFVKAGMKTLGYINMEEIEMGEGYSLTIII